MDNYNGVYSPGEKVAEVVGDGGGDGGGAGGDEGHVALWRSPRAGVNWVAASKRAEVQLPDDAYGIMASVATVSQAYVPDDISSWGNVLGAFIQGSGWEEARDAFHDDSLASITQRCIRTDAMEMGMQFVGMINLMQFATKVERYVSSTIPSNKL